MDIKIKEIERKKKDKSLNLTTLKIFRQAISRAREIGGRAMEKEFMIPQDREDNE